MNTWIVTLSLNCAPFGERNGTRRGCSEKVVVDVSTLQCHITWQFEEKMPCKVFHRFVCHRFPVILVIQILSCRQASDASESPAAEWWAAQLFPILNDSFELCSAGTGPISRRRQMPFNRQLNPVCHKLRLMTCLGGPDI